MIQKVRLDHLCDKALGAFLDSHNKVWQEGRLPRSWTPVSLLIIGGLPL